MNKAQGKKNRAAGAAFERKVRMELITEGYTVSKWNNNVDLDGKTLPFMHGCRWNRFNAAGGGFPDFVAFKPYTGFKINEAYKYELIFIEAKVNGLLTATEKKKMDFMETRGFECWIAYNDEGKVAYRKYTDYKETGRVRGKEVRHQIG